MKVLKKCLTLGLALLLLLIAMKEAGVVSRLVPAVSLRFEMPLSPEQTVRLRTLAAEHGGSLTFWSENGATASCTLRSAQTAEIIFDGDPGPVCPANYLYGRVPAMLEQGTCAVSQALAWELWGAGEVVGLTVEVQGAEYVVTGVFEARDSILLRPGQTSFSAAELLLEDAGEDGYQCARTLLQRAGIAAPCTILWGPGISRMATLLPWLWVAVEGFAALLLWHRATRKWGQAGRTILLFALLLSFALLIPMVLEQLPPWLIPTRWSDVDFWRRLTQTLRERFMAILQITPQTRDTAMKLALLKTALTSLLATFLLHQFLHRKGRNSQTQ